MALDVIAGPCSAESEEQVMRTASELKAFGIKTFRAGVWKPRTHPGSFEGVGEKGLPWLRRVHRELGLDVCTEVAGAGHVESCLGYDVDMVWIGSRTTANPFLVQEIADALEGTGVRVLVKNPVNPDLGLWVGAIERLERRRVNVSGVVHRGFSSFGGTRYRNAPGWSLAIEMHGLNPDMKFYCDPSHMGGDRAYVAEISQKALDLGLDGLMVESHCDPSSALSDAPQQLTPSELDSMLSSLTVRSKDSDDVQYKKRMNELRERIDCIDRSILELLSDRMAVSREIGREKRRNNISIIQTLRWEEVMAGALDAARAAGVDGEFVKRIFNEIHDASVAEQNKILSEKC